MDDKFQLLTGRWEIVRKNGESFVRFTKKDVKEYLDACIRFWRDRLSNATDERGQLIAASELDAFLSVRASLDLEEENESAPKAVRS